MEKIVSRVVMFWIIMIFITIALLYKHMNEEAMMFYQFGPNENLLVFGLNIDTYPKYCVIIIYCFLNSLIRTASKDILGAYLTNSVQDVSKEKHKNIRCFAYEVTYVLSIYAWIDWYIYMNLLVVQVDMLIIEITSDLIMSVVTTRYYLQNKPIQDDKSDDNNNKDVLTEEENKENNLQMRDMESGTLV